MTSFLQQLAVKVLKEGGHNPQDVLVLLPTRRSCIYFQQALREARTTPILSPRISTLRDYILSNSSIPIAEEVKQLLILYEAYLKAGGKNTLENFLPTASVMLSDFEEVDTAMLSPQLFFKNLQRLKSISVFEPGSDELKQSYHENYREFWRIFEQCYFNHREELVKRGEWSSAMVLKYLAETAQDWISVDDDRVFIAGFNHFEKYEEAVVKVLLDRGAVMVYDCDSYYFKNTAQEAGHFFRKYWQQEKWRPKQKPESVIANRSITATAVAASGLHGMAGATAHWIEELIGSGGDVSKMVVILLNKDLLQPVLYQLPANVPALNITMGLPFYQTTYASFIEALLRQLRSRKAFKLGDDVFYFKDVIALIHHPFAALFITEAQMRSIEEYIYNSSQRFLKLQTITRFCGTDVAALFITANNTRDFLIAMLKIGERLREKFLREESAGSSLYYDAPECEMRFREILVSLQSSLSSPEIPLESMLSLLQSQIKTLQLPFEGEPIRGLQLMGAMETRCLDFENVILVGMNEGVFPSDKHTKTFIPFEMRIDWMQTYRERDSISAYLFYRLLHRASNLVMIYNSSSTVLGGGEPSRFILQLRDELCNVNKRFMYTELQYQLPDNIALDTKPVLVSVTEEMKQKLNQLLFETGIAPTALISYATCPLQFYFRYVARIKEPEELVEGVEDDLLGNAVHQALEIIFQPLLGEAVKLEHLKSISDTRVAQLVKESMMEVISADDLEGGKNYLAMQVAISMVHRFLEAEVQRLSAGAELVITGLEKWLEREVAVNGRTIKLRGKADRIERVDGQLRVIDYKTGKVDRGSLFIEDVSVLLDVGKYAKALQLMCYAWLMNEDCAIQSGIYTLRSADQDLYCLYIDKNEAIEAKRLASFESEVLQPLLKSILEANVFSQTEDAQHCAYCAYNRICNR